MRRLERRAELVKLRDGGGAHRRGLGGGVLRRSRSRPCPCRRRGGELPLLLLGPPPRDPREPGERRGLGPGGPQRRGELLRGGLIEVKVVVVVTFSPGALASSLLLLLLLRPPRGGGGRGGGERRGGPRHRRGAPPRVLPYRVLERRDRVART